MDDARIRQLTDEVLAQIGSAPGAAPPSDLESRVGALESAVARLQGAAPAGPAREADTHVHVHSHPSLQVLKVGGGSERCVVEPDKPCVQSGQCRALGH
jgi:hypothetical protein